MAGRARGPAACLLAVAAAAACLLAVASRSAAQPGGVPLGPRLVEERVLIRGVGRGVVSGESTFALATTVLRPDGPGPYGVVILNHGSSALASERARAPRPRFPGVAAVFARRGFVVVMPQRRGYGETGGWFAEDYGTCQRPNYRSAGEAAAEDLIAAYQYARALPAVDPSRIVLAGQSGGGYASVYVVGTRTLPGVVAALNFAGGRGGNPRRQGAPCDVAQLTKIFGDLGAKAAVPVLFHYAQNDRMFGPETSKAFFDAFSAAGGKGEYVLQPALGTDGHALFTAPAGVRYWLPAVERFFATLDLPFERLDAGDPAKQRLLAVEQVPHARSDACRGLYKAFLEADGPRAFAIAANGRCGFAAGQDAPRRAVGGCAGDAGAACALYAVDEQVVWK
jgi:dienelactone hydrolase